MGLNVKPEHGERLAGDAAAAGGDNPIRHPPLARIVDPHHRLDDRQLGLRLARGADERPTVLRKARAAEARTGMQKLAADAAIEADPLGHVLDIGADPFAQIGDLVDKGDLGREEGVGGVFDQFGGLDVGKQHRRFEQI